MWKFLSTNIAAIIAINEVRLMLGNDVKRLAVQTHRANTSLLFVPFSISFFAQFYTLFEVTDSPITLYLSSKACRSNVILSSKKCSDWPFISSKKCRPVCDLSSKKCRDRPFLSSKKCEVVFFMPREQQCSGVC